MGLVYFVGAGLGTLNHLTIRARQLLEQAEVVIYDALAEGELLQLVPPTCLKIAVGKRGGQPSTPQEEINHLLVTYAQQGKRVIRLKSGDPLIFGRVREEVEALRREGCTWEFSPGLSSTLAAPLLMGIPLTDKDLSRCFGVATVHEPELLDWEALARLDTLVLLMGGRNLGVIVQKLEEEGRSPTTPIAIIRHGGQPQQQTWRGTLADILELTKGLTLSPCIIIIGEIVTLQDTLQPSLPLTGQTILVTRAAEQSSEFTTLLQSKGAQVIEMPTLEITPPSTWEDLDLAINHLNDFTWLILTSSNGVEYFFNRLHYLGKDARAIAGLKVAVVGKKTAASLQKYGLSPDFTPPNFVAEGLIESFPVPLHSQRILFPRVETGGRDILVKELTARGAKVTEVPAYQSQCPASLSPLVLNLLQEKQITIITFASSKTVKNFYQLLEQTLSGDLLLSLLSNVVIASIGPQTSQTCLELLGRVDIEAEEYTLEGLTEAISRGKKPG